MHYAYPTITLNFTKTNFKAKTAIFRNIFKAQSEAS